MLGKCLAVQITEINITWIQPKASLIAIARLVLSDSIALDSIGVHEKLSGGYRLTYPNKNGRYLFHPISKRASTLIEEAIFTEIRKTLKNVKNDRHHCPNS